jgi:hypothetical protein
VYVDSPSSFHALDVRLRYDPSRFAMGRVRSLRSALLVEANERSVGVVDISLASSQQLPRGLLLLLELDAKGGSRRGASVRIERIAVDGN